MGFVGRVLLGLLALASFCFVVPGQAASAGWSPIEPAPGFSGSRPAGLKVLKTEDGKRLLYWTRDVGGIPTVQSMWMAADGTPGPITDLFERPAGREFQAIMALNGDLIFAWIAPGVPNEVVKSITVSAEGIPGPVRTRSPAGGVGQPIDDLTVAVAPDGTLGFSWLRIKGLMGYAQLRIFPTTGPVAPARQVTRWPENATGVSLAARPDSKFKVAWSAYNHEIGYFNIASVSVGQDGIPFLEADETLRWPPMVPPDSDEQVKAKRDLKYVYATEKQKLDPVTGEPVRDENGKPIMVPTGADGPVKDVNLAIYNKDTSGSAANGVGILVWRHQADGTNWRVESAQFPGGGRPKGALPLSRAGSTSTNLSIQPLRKRFVASWLSEKNGVWATEFRWYKEGTPGIGWRAAADPSSSDPVVDLADNGSMMAGWTEDGLLPGVHEARVFRVTPAGVAWPVELPGLDALKSSSAPIPFADENNEPSTLVYGLDQSDVGGFWRSTYANSGIAMKMSMLNFGTGLLNINNRVGRAYMFNPGDTGTTVTDVKLTGPDANDFSLVNPTGCITGTLVDPNKPQGPKVTPLGPGEPCEVAISFAPGQVGTKNARLEVQSSAGSVSSDLTGNAIARTRVSLDSVAPKRAVRRGGKFQIKASVTNTGGIAAESLKVCMRPDRRIVKSPNKCATKQALAPGDTWTSTFRVRAKKSAPKGLGNPVSLQLQAGNADSRKIHPEVKIK